MSKKEEGRKTERKHKEGMKVKKEVMREVFKWTEGRKEI